MPRVTAIVLCALAIAPAALADDLTPPPWRFQPDTTFQHWDFSAGPGGGTPDASQAGNWTNPYGTPILTPVGSATWLPTMAGRNDVWSVFTGGELDFNIPNELDPPPHHKDLWLQVTFLAGSTLIFPGASVTTPSGNNFTMTAGPFITPLPGGWVHELTEWSYPACPGMEQVTLFPGQPGATLFVDQVVIDTICVPSPAGPAALAFGGLFMLRRRRR